jgi:diketogulonate reductase-like aldo/keto reductase
MFYFEVWNTFHSQAAVMEGMNGSLKNLGLEYLDLFLIHWPMGYLVRNIL